MFITGWCPEMERVHQFLELKPCIRDLYITYVCVRHLLVNMAAPLLFICDIRFIDLFHCTGNR